MRPIGILGGTFDPIHLGHIQLALATYHHFKLSQVRFIPVNIPPHRTMPVASADDRKAMLALALTEYDELSMDCRELESNETSYTINTLQSLRKELPDSSLCLIMGLDAFNRIDTWHRWQHLLEYAHILVVSRPGETISISHNSHAWLREHQTNDINNISKAPCGQIFISDLPTPDISSTRIRAAAANRQDIKQWLHPSTESYIAEHKLYQDTT